MNCSKRTILRHLCISDGNHLTTIDCNKIFHSEEFLGSRLVFANLNFIVFHTLLKIILQDYVNLEIIKKRGSSINPDIHHSKKFSSVELVSFVVPIFTARCLQKFFVRLKKEEI